MAIIIISFALTEAPRVGCRVVYALPSPYKKSLKMEITI
jgi:hypothetical protein